ncbi:MAG: hypothetical protein DIZ78_07005 [endosymbiont of Escarpia spicata]|uniref:Uncharacterized protein n=1 Tax=endosymbiont of Escarpia spicata TaxID=2200908 RepID=A0A370DP06_9GAMM|nr:MAG: hypothetical protein DIZ78_07005 [endosymbiont of Escarpia spicata]
MLLVAAGVGAAAIVMLYQTAFEQQRLSLMTIVKSQARLLEAVASFDLEHAPHYKQNPTEATLSQVDTAFQQYAVEGSSKEFVLGRRSGESIEILIRSSTLPISPKRLSIREGGNGTPMRRALQGLSGSMLVRDFRSVKVFAAYEPVAVLNMGVVAKIDLAEIRAPFVVAGGWLILVSMVLIALGSLLFFRVSNPLLAELRQRGEALHTLMESTVGLTGQDYFDKVVSELCHWLGADGASINEMVAENRVLSIAMKLDGDKIEGFTYSLAGTPCENVVRKGACLYQQDVCRLFPEDQELIDLQAEGYVGVPVRRSIVCVRKRPCGRVWSNTAPWWRRQRIWSGRWT